MPSLIFPRIVILEALRRAYGEHNVLSLEVLGELETCDDDRKLEEMYYHALFQAGRGSSGIQHDFASGMFLFWIARGTTCIKVSMIAPDNNFLTADFTPTPGSGPTQMDPWLVRLIDSHREREVETVVALLGCRGEEMARGNAQRLAESIQFWRLLWLLVGQPA